MVNVIYSHQRSVSRVMLLFLFLLFYFYFFLFLFQGTRVTQRGIYQWIDEKYKIPSCEPTIKSGMIDVSYVLVFKVSVRCCPDLVMRLPITIGTNPHISSTRENQEQRDHQQIWQSREQNMVQESK